MSKIKINIDEIHARGILGVDDWERTYQQDILISITLTVNAKQVVESDCVEDTVNYRTLKKEVLDHVSRAERRTVEALAQDLVEICIDREHVLDAKVRVEKPDALRGADGVSVVLRADQDE